MVLMKKIDMEDMGVEDGEREDIVGELDDGVESVEENLSLVNYEIKRG